MGRQGGQAMAVGEMKLIIKILFCTATLLIACFAHANNCRGLEHQVNYADKKLNQGGNSSYMKFWRQSRDAAEKKLSQCRRSIGHGEPQITVYSGERKNNTQDKVAVSSDIDDPALQQLIKTCNYWVNESDRNPSPENRAFRDNACRDARAAEHRILNPQAPVVLIRNRTLKECIKPNQVIDNEVKECMEGMREPTWN